MLCPRKHSKGQNTRIKYELIIDNHNLVPKFKIFPKLIQTSKIIDKIDKTVIGNKIIARKEEIQQIQSEESLSHEKTNAFELLFTHNLLKRENLQNYHYEFSLFLEQMSNQCKIGSTNEQQSSYSLKEVYIDSVQQGSVISNKEYKFKS